MSKLWQRRSIVHLLVLLLYSLLALVLTWVYRRA